MKLNTKLLMLSLTLLSTLNTMVMKAMNQDPNKGLSIEEQLKARRTRLQQNDAQQQAVVQHEVQAVQNQCAFIDAINGEINSLINGLHNAQTYDAIFVLLGDIITELQRPYENISIIDMHASQNQEIVQALKQLCTCMEKIIIAVQQSAPLRSYILEKERLGQFDIQLQHIAQILKYKHTGSLIEIEMNVDQDEELAEMLQEEELNFETFNNNNNNNIIVEDDEIIITETIAPKTQSNNSNTNNKKRKLEDIDTEKNKKLKPDFMTQAFTFTQDFESIDLFATPTYPNRGSSFAALSQTRFGDIWLMAREGKLGVVKNLLKKDQTLLNKRDSVLGITPLASAASNNRTDVVEFLLEEGADVTTTNRFKQTVLITAVINKFTKIAELLLKNEVDVNIQDYEGNTALHYAARENNIKLVKLLLANKADVNLKNKAGHSPLDLALSIVHNEKRAVSIVILLLQHGAKPSVSNWIETWNNHLSSTN
ncbi:ankyrin repeat domain-containing protein [Candidatus Dependentiae bacterium]|jgi:hypothetical protein|nr:ankyrin repeat domain-containing protein [Candidatus Dependentiae bacterium]